MMKTTPLKITIIAVAIFGKISADVQSSKAIIHNTKLGSIRGLEISNQRTVELYKFLNIPYAQPPLRRLRFTKPRPRGPWKKTLNATAHGPACPQIYNRHFVKYGMDEDCLHLNIYAPPDLSRSSRKTVMVWVHGGSYTVGSASFYDGSMLAKTGNVIVVTINYRLGLLGFFALKNSTTKGNYGLWDQMMALQWVKDNIDDYGGDPNSITLFGQSAGGFSVGLLALIPQNQGLFHRVIMQSGVPNSSLKITRPGFDTYTTSDAISIHLCPFLKSVLAMRVICLRYSSSPIVTRPSSYLSFAPVVDHELFEQSPEEILKEGNSSAFQFFMSLDIVVTNCDVDGSVLFPTLKVLELSYKFDSSTPPELVWAYGPETMLESYYGRNKRLIAEVSSFYGFSRDSNFQDQCRKWTALYTDLFFIAPSTEIADVHCNRLSSTFRLVLTRRSPVYPGLMYNESSPPGWFHGAAHSDDVVYLFLIESLQELDPNTTVTASSEDLQFASNLRRYWSNFAKTGNPNDQSLPYWPSYNIQSKRFMMFGQNISSNVSYRNEESKFWLDTIPNIVHVMTPSKHSTRDEMTSSKPSARDEMTSSKHSARDEMTSSKPSTRDDTRNISKLHASSAGFCCFQTRVKMFMFSLSVIISRVL